MAAVTKTGDSTAERIRVMVADSQALYRVGLRKVFAVEDDIRMVAQTESLGQTLTALSKFPTDVLLFEETLCPNCAEAVTEITRRAPSVKVVVVTHQAGEDETVEYLRRGARGILDRSVGPDLMIKCIRKVAEGETWLDNQAVNWVIDAYRAQASKLTAPRSRTRLNDKEMLIVSYVSQGWKNRDIAQEVGTTEQVIKNYLRKIYDRLGVADRLELALYCIHHRILQKGTPVVPPQAEEQASAAAATSGHKM
jgi:DNA-binding NarL/FixJ family response regulator